jgi:preprotein translocase subunit Sss1
MDQFFNAVAVVAGMVALGSLGFLVVVFVAAITVVVWRELRKG